jgi:23S rRNA (adenine2503-C2)-methyltransferase
MQPQTPITQDVMTIKRILPEDGLTNIVGLTRDQVH